MSPSTTAEFSSGLLRKMIAHVRDFLHIPKSEGGRLSQMSSSLHETKGAYADLVNRYQISLSCLSKA
jgi:hypothetical protein